MSIKDMVKDGKKVTFQYYRAGELIYKTECGFVFPVPVKDVGDATFLAEDKAILFMRYINWHFKALDAVKAGEAMADEEGGQLLKFFANKIN